MNSVAIALSGGVDSAVAALLLKDRGYDVFGITMSISEYSNKKIETAAQVAAKLDIPHHVIDLKTEFNNKVIKPFCHNYGVGKTPNPCVLCNYYIKFNALAEKAKELGANLLATGHYAHILETGDGFKLLKGIDSVKDQSYFLYMLEQERLKNILMPLGGLSKAEVKKIAIWLGIDTVIEHESQDICFIPNNGFDQFISENVITESGNILDVDGKVIGQHQGLAYYTIGQRQGLGLSSNTRRYIIRLDSDSNTIILGEREQLFLTRLRADNLTWISGKVPSLMEQISAKIRYRAPESPVKIRFIDDYCEVEFEQPQWAITPGQSVVFYRGDEVLGGGII
ncbi:MAG TPA: tRNA 2-thiouridine(34) synthase MnmA, partial [Dehalococcoidia bacterium]|nr:tRNA 2-thiouridine(34) synthase MnmA [Dehalococcoidia bacterium]